VYLGELHARLVELAQRRVRAGEVTERGLARRCGMSQPHLHNVLKHIRALSNDAADRLMQALGVTIADLLWAGLGDAGGDLRAVPVVRNRLGPGADAALGVYRGTMALAASLVAGLVDPVAARLAPDLALPRGWRRTIWCCSIRIRGRGVVRAAGGCGWWRRRAACGCVICARAERFCMW
jgi:hypothetical protein